MSTKYIASNWRLPNQENSSKNDNYGLTFDGSEFIDLDIQSLNTPATISIWVNTAVNDSQQRYAIINGRADQTPYLYLRMATDNTYQVPFFNSNGSDTLQGSSATINTWFHFVIVCEDSQTLLYENGVLKDTSTTGWNGVNINQSNNWQIGRDSRGQRFWSGSISECALFDYALSESQISTLYGSSSLGAGNPMALKPAPVAYYPLGDNSASNPLTQPNEAVADASVFEVLSNDSIDFSNGLLSDLSAFTISFWYNRGAANGTTATLIKQNGVISINQYRQSASYSGLEILLTTVNGQSNILSTSQGNVPTGEWLHVGIVYDGSNMTLFRNGSQAAGTYNPVAATGNTVNNTNVFEIFAQTSLQYGISNLQIWNTALSAPEVTTLYNSGVPLLTGTQPQASNLKAWYKLDQSANWDVSSSGNWTIPDASGNGNDGTSSGMTSASLILTDLTRNLPYDSYSFNFSGTTDYLEIAHSSTLEPANVSVSIWFKGSAQAAINTYLVSKVANTGSKGYGLYTGNSTDKLVFFIYNGSTWILTPLGGVVMDDNWHHAVATYDGNNLKLYVDGSSYASNTSASGITYNAGPLVIAAQTTVPALDFDGKLSNCAIFNQALTSTEVMKLYSNGVPQDLSSFSPAPVSWWTLGSNSFFNGTDYICRDLIGSNDGTSANAGVDALVGDAPRSEANGTGTNIDIPTNLEGSTKWSSNNSWSINMSETARVEDTP